MGRAPAAARLSVLVFVEVVGCTAPAGRWAGVADRWQQVAAYYDAGGAGSSAAASAAPRLRMGVVDGQRSTPAPPNSMLRAVADRAVPSVVHVAVSRQRPNHCESSRAARPTCGTFGGTGVVIDARGLVLTNAHVVRGAEHVTICCTNGRRCAVEQIAMDDAADLALLRVAADELGELRVAPADIRPGTAVIALGRPAPESIQSSHGHVTTMRRSLVARLGGSAYANLIESSALPQPGFSGGPLLDEHGHWVGVNVARARQDGEVRGYAIPLSPEVCRTITRLVAAVALQPD